MKIFTTFLQILLISLVFLAGQGITSFLHLQKLPGSIVGVGILFCLLKFRVIRLEWVEKGAKWLLAELMLFFIPPTVGIIQFPQIFGLEGLRVVAVVWISLVIVMSMTGLIAEHLQKRKKGQAI
jgi:holin-like protein